MTRSRRPAQAAAPLVVSFVVLLYAVAAAAQVPGITARDHGRHDRA
jgi:hypothetical protein